MEISSVNNNYKQPQNGYKQNLMFGMIRVPNTSTALALKESIYMPAIIPLEKVKNIKIPEGLSEAQIKKLQNIADVKHCFMTPKEFLYIKRGFSKGVGFFDVALARLEKKVKEALSLTNDQLEKIEQPLKNRIDGIKKHKDKLKSAKNELELLESMNQAKTKEQRDRENVLKIRISVTQSIIKFDRKRFAITRKDIRRRISCAAENLKDYKEPSLLCFRYKKKAPKSVNPNCLNFFL